VASGVAWNNVGDCGAYFIDYGTCARSVAFHDIPWYDHTNSPFYDHDDTPWGNHTDTPWYDHNDTPWYNRPFYDHTNTTRTCSWANCSCSGGEHWFAGDKCSHINGTCVAGLFYNCPATETSHSHSYTGSGSGDVDINFDNVPHDHHYIGSDRGHSDISHSHSFSGGGSGHEDIQHEHDYGWNPADGGSNVDRGHSDITHTNTYTPPGSDRGHYDIERDVTPHVNFCNHIDTGEGERLENPDCGEE
jgi:hypothetical protein